MPLSALDYTERLANVVRVLHALPKDRKSACGSSNFDLNVWKKETHSCGASGCAIGWPAQDQYFNNLGLTLTILSKPTVVIRHGKRMTVSLSLQTFFGITSAEITRLFMPCAYARGTRSDVLSRIKRTVISHLSGVEFTRQELPQVGRILNLLERV